jgi:hypothetical protein
VYGSLHMYLLSTRSSLRYNPSERHISPPSRLRTERSLISPLEGCQAFPRRTNDRAIQTLTRHLLHDRIFDFDITTSPCSIILMTDPYFHNEWRFECTGQAVGSHCQSDRAADCDGQRLRASVTGCVQARLERLY